MKRALLILSFLAAPLFGDENRERAAGKVVTTEEVTGNGIHTYVTVPGFGAMPDGADLGPTHGGVAVDSQGRVYVSTEAKHSVAVFDEKGKYVKSIASDFVGLHSLLLEKEGEKEVLWAAQVGSQRVVKLDLDGQLLFQIPNEKTGEIPQGLKGVTAVAVGSDGRSYVACGYGSNLIHMFDEEGKWLKAYGEKGSAENQFSTCHGLIVDTRFGEPRLLVCDRENRRLVHLTMEMEWIGVHSENLRRPCTASIFGDFLAVAELEGRVTILEKSGTPVAFLGDQPDPKLRAKKPIPVAQLYDGLFTSPHGLSYDAEGNLYVQDWNVTGRVTALRLLK